MTRAYTNLDAEARDLGELFARLRAPGQPAGIDGSPEDIALCSIETFVAIALRVMKRTNPSKIRDAARTVEIQARLDGRPVLNAEGEPT